MIHSMTAFARFETRSDAGALIWEIRSLNHRYLEVNLKLPENFSILEMSLRERIKKYLQRGKVDITLRYQTASNLATTYQLNENLLQYLLTARQTISAKANNEALAPINAFDLLRWPDMLQTSNTSWENLQQEALTAFESALQQLVKTRQTEGQAITALLEQRLQAMRNEVSKVHAELPQILQLQRDKLINRFNEANIVLDNNRLEQELVMFAQKIDIAEELDRLTTHIEETRRTLHNDNAQGRRLDFLAQELQREANTLASKSVSPVTTLAAVQLKVLIEQLREQVQNVE